MTQKHVVCFGFFLVVNWSWFHLFFGDPRFFHEAALVEELDPATYGTIVMATGSVSHWWRSLLHLQEMTWQNFHVDTGIISSAACGCEKSWEQFRPQRIVFSWALSKWNSLMQHGILHFTSLRWMTTEHDKNLPRSPTLFGVAREIPSCWIAGCRSVKQSTNCSGW